GDGGKPIPRATIESWKQRDRWDEAPSIRRMDDAIEIQFMVAVSKPKKTAADLAEIDARARAIATMARVRRYEQPGGHEGDLNEKVGNRNAGPRKKPKRNHFTEEQVVELK